MRKQTLNAQFDHVASCAELKEQWIKEELIKDQDYIPDELDWCLGDTNRVAQLNANFKQAQAKAARKRKRQETVARLKQQKQQKSAGVLVLQEGEVVMAKDGKRGYFKAQIIKIEGATFTIQFLCQSGERTCTKDCFRALENGLTSDGIRKQYGLD